MIFDLDKFVKCDQLRSECVEVILQILEIYDEYDDEARFLNFVNNTTTGYDFYLNNRGVCVHMELADMDGTEWYDCFTIPTEWFECETEEQLHSVIQKELSGKYNLEFQMMLDRLKGEAQNLGYKLVKEEE